MVALEQLARVEGTAATVAEEEEEDVDVIVVVLIITVGVSMDVALEAVRTGRVVVAAVVTLLCFPARLRSAQMLLLSNPLAPCTQQLLIILLLLV